MSIQSLLRSLIALFTALSLIACTSMQAMQATDKVAVRQSVKVGDEVSVVAANGKTYLLKLIAVDDEKIVGVGDNLKVTIRYEQIQSMEVRRFSKGRTAGLAGGTVAVLAVAATVLVAIAFKDFGKALGQMFCFGQCDDDEDE